MPYAEVSLPIGRSSVSHPATAPETLSVPSESLWYLRSIRVLADREVLTPGPLCYLRGFHGVPVEMEFLWMVGRGFSSQARVPGP